MAKFIVLIISILLLFNQYTKAQDINDDDISVMVFGNSLIPIGSFGDNIGERAAVTRRFGFDIGEKAGLSKLGFGFGVEISKKVFIPDLAWVISAKFLINPTDVSRLTSFFNHELDDSADISFENGSWANIPIFTGFTYSCRLSESINIYGTLQAGINITKEASRKAMAAGIVVEDISYNFIPDFGFEFGLGAELFDKYNIGIRYINLGTPRYEGVRRLNESFFTSIPQREMNIDSDPRPVNMILIFLGYNL